MTFIKGQSPWNKGRTYSSRHKGRPLSERHKKALRVKHKGNGGKYKRTEYHKNITSKGLKEFYKKGGRLGFRLKKYYNVGEKNSNWKGGITPTNEKIRKSVQYKLWVKACLERDNYTCVFCFQRGGDLEVDHIKPFALFPELRFAIDNGRTLCADCHRKTDTYGSKIKSYKL